MRHARLDYLHFGAEGIINAGAITLNQYHLARGTPEGGLVISV